LLPFEVTIPCSIPYRINLGQQLLLCPSAAMRYLWS
jgi:hypothetical protein